MTLERVVFIKDKVAPACTHIIYVLVQKLKGGDALGVLVEDIVLVASTPIEPVCVRKGYHEFLSRLYLLDPFFNHPHLHPPLLPSHIPQLHVLIISPTEYLDSIRDITLSESTMNQSHFKTFSLLYLDWGLVIDLFGGRQLLFFVSPDSK